MTARQSRRKQQRGFTIAEVLVAVSVIAILAAVTIVGYNFVQRRSSDGAVQHTLSDALRSLQVYYALNRAYPSNLADTDYSPPLSVAVAFYTDAAQTPVYSNLTPEQNAQLFLNACNGYMPIVSGGVTYNTSCAYAGNNAHIAGQVSSNVIIHGPSIVQSDFILTCGPACTTAQNNILSTFTSQGGTFPLAVPKSGSILPQPTMQSAGAATRFCIEGRSPQFVDVVYHAKSDNQSVEDGPCVADPTLHYP